MDKHFVIENKIIKGVKCPSKIKNAHNIGKILLKFLDKYENSIAQRRAETGEHRTYKVIKNRSIRCALWLKKQGIGPGDVISICTDNQFDSCIPVLAALYTGAIFNPWHHEQSLALVRHYMKLCEPKIIFACASAVSVIMEAAELEKMSPKIIVLGHYIDVESLEDIINRQSNEEVDTFEPQEIKDPKQTALILLSSGTTGLPKVVAHHYDVILQSAYELCAQIDTCIALWYSNLAWMTGTLFTLKFLLSGSTIIYHSVCTPEGMFDVIEQYKVNWIFLAPSVIASCCKANIFDKYTLKSLHRITTGSTLLNPKYYTMFQKNFPHIFIEYVYGITEILGLVCSNTENNETLDSIGYVLPNKEVKIVDTTTNEILGPNQSGEIHIKSPIMMSGYYKNPEATKEVIDEEGWYHSGDIGYYTEDGKLQIIDRIKEVIKYRSFPVPPAEVEQLLITHPAVMDVAVAPIPDDVDGELPMAFVKKVPGAEVTEEELIELSSTLGNNKKLRGGIKFIERIPYTTSGKIRRSELKEMAKKFQK